MVCNSCICKSILLWLVILGIVCGTKQRQTWLNMCWKQRLENYQDRLEVK